ncbi:hypothetical protein ACLKA6_015794 [Drosophila palustris]
MKDIELKLIRGVQRHPCLYNKSNIGFRNRQLREKAWASVAAVCGLPVNQTKKRWKLLRDRFVREQHKSEEDRAWEFYYDMLYLLEHIQVRVWQNIECETQMELDNQIVKECNGTSELDSVKVDISNVDELEEYTMSEEAVNETSGNQAESEFVKVMDMLKSVLEKKLSEEKSTTPSGTHCGSQCKCNAEQDPFYKYLESILNRVNETKRVEIQFDLLNLANSLVKKAK